MLAALVDVVNFDVSGAFVERTPSDAASGHHHHPQQQQQQQRPSSLESSLGSSLSNGSSGSSDADATASLNARGPPSFESFLAVPLAFTARHATHSATEATLLLEVARAAIEMDAVVECALEQLQDRHQLMQTVTNAEGQQASAGASMATTLLVLLHQAAMSNTQTLATLLQRMQACLERLQQIMCPLAQCIESNMLSTRELEDDALTASRRVLADVEIDLLGRLESLLEPTPTFQMTPLAIPRGGYPRGEAGTTQICWPGSSSFLASAASPSRGVDDVRLSSSTPSSLSSSSSSSASRLAAMSSSTTQTASLLLSNTPVREPRTSTHMSPLDGGDRSHSDASSANGSSRQNVESSSDSSGRQHSQPRL